MVKNWSWCSPGLCADPRFICHRHGLVAGKDCWFVLDWGGVLPELFHWYRFLLTMSLSLLNCSSFLFPCSRQWQVRQHLQGSRWIGRRQVVVVVVRRAYTRRHNYRVTSAPPSRLSLHKQKCLQWSTEFAKLSVWPSQFRRQAVPDPGAGSGKTPVAKMGTGPRDDARVHVGQTQTAAKLVRGGQDAIVSKVRRRQQHFTISEVAADCHEPMVPQRIMWRSIARANGQLDPRCS